MSTLNSIPFTAAGNLTADPELRFTGTGKPVAGLRIAVTPRRFDRDTNSYVDGTTTFVDGQVWGEQAEHLAESLHKGDRVLVIGRWVTRVFTPTQGPNEGVEQRRWTRGKSGWSSTRASCCEMVGLASARSWSLWPGSRAGRSCCRRWRCRTRTWARRTDADTLLGAAARAKAAGGDD